MEVLLSDIVDNVADLGQNFDVTTIDNDNTIRQINRAIEYVQRRLGLPSDKQVFSFYYYDDTKYYNCVPGFNELLGLFYNTNGPIDKNRDWNIWNVVKEIDILNSTAQWSKHNRVAFTSLNGKNQLLLKGRNVQPGQVINGFDAINGLSFSNDISGQVIDSYVYQQGTGSLKFNINTGLSATTISFTGSWDITSPLLNGGVFRMYIDFPVGTSTYFSNIELQLVSSTGNYFDMNTSTQTNGTAWTENTFNQVSFSLANATTIGTPVANQITQINVILNHSASFAPLTNIRLDYLYQINPDYMDCVFYSAYKGTDTSGTTQKIYLDTPSDIVAFGAYAYDLIGPISLRAALNLWPQLRSSEIFWQMYKADFTDVMQTFSRSYPRERTMSGANATHLRR